MLNVKLMARAFSKSIKIDPKINYYKEIGLHIGAAEEDIKKSYYALAKKYHPDSTEGLTQKTKEEFEDKFKRISAAYEILSDPTRKKNYDELVAVQKFQNNFQSSQAARAPGDVSSMNTNFKASSNWKYTYDSQGNKRKVYVGDDFNDYEFRK